MHNTKLKTASIPEEQETLEVRTRSGRISRPPSRLIDETGHTSQSRSRSRSSLHPPPRPRQERTPAPSITVTDSAGDTPERGRSPTLERQHLSIRKAYEEPHKTYQHLQYRRASLVDKLNHKWDVVLDAATRKKEHLFSQYLEQLKAIVENLGKLDSEVDENQYKFHLAAFNQAQYNLAIHKGTDKEEQHAHNEGFYLSRINEYHEGSRPSKEETEDLLGRFI